MKQIPISRESSTEIGLTSMLIASWIYLSCILAEIGLQKEFCTLQTGQVDESYSRCFVWLNQSQFLINNSFLLLFFWYHYTWFIYTRDCDERSYAFDGSPLRYTDIKQIMLIPSWVVRSYLAGISTLVLYLIWTVMLLFLTQSSLHSHDVLVINPCR